MIFFRSVSLALVRGFCMFFLFFFFFLFFSVGYKIRSKSAWEIVEREVEREGEKKAKVCALLQGVRRPRLNDDDVACLIFGEFPLGATPPRPPSDRSSWPARILVAEFPPSLNDFSECRTFSRVGIFTEGRRRKTSSFSIDFGRVGSFAWLRVLVRSCEKKDPCLPACAWPRADYRVVVTSNELMRAGRPTQTN